MAYLPDLVGSGQKDETWVPTLSEQGWIVITADRGKQTKGGATKKLPAICVELEVTHVVFGKSIHELPLNKKLRTLIGLWDDMVNLVATEAKGVRIQIDRKLNGWDLRIVRKSPTKKVQHPLTHADGEEIVPKSITTTKPPKAPR